MSADERINRLEVVMQEQRHLLASQIQISHDATVRHEAAMAEHEAAIAKINATLDRLAEASLETERRWQAYLSRIPKQ